MSIRSFKKVEQELIELKKRYYKLDESLTKIWLIFLLIGVIGIILFFTLGVSTIIAWLDSIDSSAQRSVGGFVWGIILSSVIFILCKITFGGDL
jgi:integral membrane sensor domain MASE1